MCGRYTLHHTPDEITERFPVRQLRFDWEPRYNIAPSQCLPVIRDGSEWRLDGLQWGLVPFWAKEAKVGNQLINARAETISTKPAFRHAFTKRRCLIPADGFYEWRKSGRERWPVHIRLKGGGLFAFAGLWEEWHPPGGAQLLTFTIITVPANSLLETVHPRMPAILRPENEARWLDPGGGQVASPDFLFQTPSADEFELYPVSRRVNSPACEGPGCLEPEKSKPVQQTLL